MHVARGRYAGCHSIGSLAGPQSLVAWSGGLFGAIYIAISIVLVPRIGTMSFVALLVAGQMLCFLIFDHYGLFGVPEHPIDMGRMLRAVLLVAGSSSLGCDHLGMAP